MSLCIANSDNIRYVQHTNDVVSPFKNNENVSEGLINL